MLKLLFYKLFVRGTMLSLYEKATKKARRIKEREDLAVSAKEKAIKSAKLKLAQHKKEKAEAEAMLNGYNKIFGVKED